MASEVMTQLNRSDEQRDESLGYAFMLIRSSTLPRILHAAVELGILKILANEGPDSKLSASEIAMKMPTRNPDAPVMQDRMLRLLASHQVLDCSITGRDRLYSLNSVSKYFVPNQNGVSLAPSLALFHDKVLLESWSQLKESVLEGECSFKRVHGVDIFELCSMDLRFSQVFHASMFHHSSLIMEKMLERYKGFENLKQLVDVGGGLGHSLKAITSKYPHIKALNFDLLHVIQHAPAHPGVENVAGDMFESVPKGDAIFMKSILHKWNNEHCLRLLKSCYEAVPDDGKVIIVDSVVPVVPNSSVAARANSLSDLNMMNLFGSGKNRTEPEYLALATGAGFRGLTHVCYAASFSIMEFFKYITGFIS